MEKHILEPVPEPVPKRFRILTVPRFRFQSGSGFWRFRGSDSKAVPDFGGSGNRFRIFRGSTVPVPEPLEPAPEPGKHCPMVKKMRIVVSFVVMETHGSSTDIQRA
uniref:Uncharacterized protein n=1 Tax=Globodera pallida TaxID=36090 RepID=A0A183CIK5_GLOPA